MVTPVIGIGADDDWHTGCDKCFRGLLIDHYGLFDTIERKIDNKRIIALFFIIAALIFMAKG